MKKLLFSLATLFTLNMNAQKFEIKVVSFGIMVPVYGIAPLPFVEKPFGLGYDLTPSVNLITNRTHHHLRYGVDKNTIQTINGVFLTNDWDVYNFYSNNLNTKAHYLGFGVEKLIVNSPHFLIFGFGEVGTSFSKTLISFGIVLHPNIPIWIRK